MSEWVSRGLHPRIARRLESLGLADNSDLAAWLDAHQDGDEVLGRVMVAELHSYLAGQAPD